MIKIIAEIGWNHCGDLELAKKTLSNKEFPPRLKWEEKPFRLCNVYWQTKEKTNQMELLDE